MVNPLEKCKNIMIRKLYRKSNEKENNFHPFSNPDDFKDYVNIKIYDINTENY